MPQSRQLAAIMFTDIVGYTAIMGENEQKAIELLHQNRQIQQPLIRHFNGTFIKEMGDGILASFSAATDAVRCAIAIQKRCGGLPNLKLHIGIHLGDIVFEGKDVFGDGVNIAARLQAVAPEGDVLVSEAVYASIKNKVDFDAEYFGEETLKNVAVPLRIYRVKVENSDVTEPAVNHYPKNVRLKGKRIGKKLLLYILGLFLLLTAGTVVYFKFSGRSNTRAASTTTSVEKSIAVLPFVNLNDDKEQEYFSDGLSEELLNLLAKVPELKVIGRTSSFSFKGKNEDLRSIAQKLGVAHILEGSVRKDGNRVRVRAQLIKATDGSQLWSDRYDRNFEDIFKMQDEIAGAVVNQLKLKLLIPKTNATSSATNTEVYNLVLQGNYLLEKRDKESLAKALDLYFKALAIDSTDARTWAAVAKCYELQMSWKWTEVNQGAEKAMKAATKSIALDHTQADAYMVLGKVKMYVFFDWDGAEADFQKALNLEPGNADVLRCLGLLYRTLGRFDEATLQFKQSLILDPIKNITYFNYGQLLYYANRLEEAIASYKKILELDPLFLRARMYLGMAYLSQGKAEMALAVMQQEKDKDFKYFCLALAYHALGRRQEADEALTNFIARYQNNWPFQIAEIYAFRGEKGKALEWLEKAYAKKEMFLTFLKGDPLLKNLEGDPRHTALLKKMNLPTD